jgi:hypothetical protein
MPWNSPTISTISQRSLNDLSTISQRSPNDLPTQTLCIPLNKSKRGRRDDAGELKCHDEKLGEEYSLLWYHYEPLEDKLAKVHPDLLEELSGSKDDDESMEVHNWRSAPRINLDAVGVSMSKNISEFFSKPCESTQPSNHSTIQPFNHLNYLNSPNYPTVT